MASGATARESTPSKVIVPVDGSTKRGIEWMSVVLPHPLGPASATIWPARIDIVTSLSTVVPP
jgi:hypothetical protein